jgi:hypothetical protein
VEVVTVAELVLVLGFLAVGVTALLLTRRTGRAERWHEHRSRHEQADAERALSERLW